MIGGLSMDWRRNESHCEGGQGLKGVFTFAWINGLKRASTCISTSQSSGGIFLDLPCDPDSML